MTLLIRVNAVDTDHVRHSRLCEKRVANVQQPHIFLARDVSNHQRIPLLPAVNVLDVT